MKLRTVLADDEPLARERLGRFIADDPELVLTAQCRSGKEVRDALVAHEADLLLLDIQMPGLTGLEVAQEVRQRVPMVIFVTAHDQYASRAFDIEAVDYLLKPVEPQRFQEAIKRAKDLRQMKSALAIQDRFASALSALESLATNAEPVRPARYVIRSGAKDLFVAVHEIAWIEAADYYVCLHTADKKHMLRESIKRMEAQLDPRKFVRVHRSAIVNIDCVREIHREGRSEGWTLLSNGDRVRMSVQGWQKLLAASVAS